MSDTGREESTKLNIAVTSGAGTGTIARTWSIARYVRVIPPSESAGYTISIKDGDGDLMISRTGQLGTFSEKLHLSLGIAATIAISAADTDGTYKAKFDMH